MISSPKGKEMISYISPIYEQSKVMQSIFEAIGSEFDSAEELSEDILKQLFPQTATWGLIYWEDAVKIIPNLNEDIERRRGKIIAKLQSRYVVNPKKMANIIKNYIGIDTIIVENTAPYTFTIEMDIKNNINLSEFIHIVNRVKPSHLGYNFTICCNTELNLNTKLNKYEFYNNMCGTFNCGTIPDYSNRGVTIQENITIKSNNNNWPQKYKLTGTFKVGD